MQHGGRRTGRTRLSCLVDKNALLPRFVFKHLHASSYAPFKRVLRVPRMRPLSPSHKEKFFKWGDSSSALIGSRRGSRRRSRKEPGKGPRTVSRAEHHAENRTGHRTENRAKNRIKKQIVRRSHQKFTLMKIILCLI